MTAFAALQRRTAPADTPGMVAKRILMTSLACMVLLTVVPNTSHAGHTAVPEWVKPALSYLVRNGHLERSKFHANSRMRRADFKSLMHSVFGGGYRKARGYVKEREVSSALVRRLGKRPVARHIVAARSPNGWHPGTTWTGGFATVAREMGLRRDRSPSEERFETSSHQLMRQADIVYSVWKAKTSPSTWGADALMSFELGNYGWKRKKVVAYAMSLLGKPYVWAGEWARPTPSGYPYGHQPAGGFDCSGFLWYVLKQKHSGYEPLSRPYRGWALNERSSSDMARRTPTRLAFRGLRPGDVMFFAPDGPRSSAAQVYHAGLYLGKGWMIHSSGSRAGVSLASVRKGTWWRSQFAWGRRVIS